MVERKHEYSSMRLAKLELLPKSAELPTWNIAASVTTAKSVGNDTVSLPW
ncbi:hypothetical protein [Vibrio alginolyticus]|nr:hypothetical protein [Vibrio alginolyticus]MDG2723179.1 hypothetical protein [Vibrio parahaemolyticus]